MNKFVTTKYIYAEDIKKIRKKTKINTKRFCFAS